MNTGDPYYTQKRKNSRNLSWQTHLGNTVSVKGCSDEHLANTIQFFTLYRGRNEFDFIQTLRAEAKRRKLTQEFLDKAQYPYKDGLGNYIVWDFEKDTTKIVGKYSR